MKDNDQQKLMNNLGHHVIKNLETDLRKKFAAWNQFAADGIAEMDTKPERFPHMPVELQVVTMKVADGQIYDTVGLEDLPSDGGVPMKVQISDPYFIEFKNAKLPDSGKAEYTSKDQMPGLVKAILAEHPKSVAFVHVSESWVWRADLDKYVPYDEDPNAGPREEALVVTFQGMNGVVMTGVMPIAEEGGLRYLKDLEFGTPFMSSGGFPGGLTS